MLAYITGTVDQELLLRNEYLATENRILKAQLKGLCLVKTWSARLIGRWSRADVGDLVPDSSGDPWSAPEIVRQHVKWDAAMVVECGCEQLRCRIEWHP